MSDSAPTFSLRVSFAGPPQAAGPAAAMAARSKPSARMAAALTRGLQQLAFKAAKDRFSGKGPFPVSERRLGNVSGRLKRDIHAEPATIAGGGYRGRIGSVVEYFAAHELGFSGTVSVAAHARRGYTMKKRGYSVLPQSVRAHSKTVRIPARRPLATAITEHAGAILGAEIDKAARGAGR